jgi:hypothetical protein
VDNQFPYRIYGAQQDNTTVIIPSLPTGNGQDFRVGPGCETGPVIPDLTRPEIVYGSCKGQFSRLNLNTANEQRYWVGGESLYGNGGATLIYRFQRVSPMELSPHDQRVIYYGSQYVHRSRDGGVTWDKISPDMTAFPPGEPQEASGTPITRDATGEEVYSTLYSIRESPVQKGVIWTGSNDGPIWVTRDDGKTWTNVTPKDLPPGGRVQNIEPSPHRAGTAYAAIYRYLLGDFAPYLYRTDDFGKTWTRLTDGKNGIAADEPTRVVREDPVRPRLLYAGTEFAFYTSFDDGATWQRFQQGLPPTPVTDIRLAHGDLILATQGRGYWILDNLAPLRQVNDMVAAAAQHLFTPRDAIRAIAGRGGRGLSFPASGAQIDFYLAKAPEGDLTMDILDAAGNVVRRFSSASTGPVAADDDAAGGDDEDGGPRIRSGPTRLDKSPGMHRFTWDLRYPGPWQSAARTEGGIGPMAVPGQYAVRLTSGSWTATQPLTVVQDPRTAQDGVTLTDLREQFEHNVRVRDLVSESNKTVARLRTAMSGASGDKEIKLRDLSRRLITPTIRYSKPELSTQITYLYTVTNSTDQKPGRDVVERYQTLRKELEARMQELEAILK